MNPMQPMQTFVSNSAVSHFYKTGVKPGRVEVSRGLYRRLMEIRSVEALSEGAVVGCTALRELTTSIGRLSVVIDEHLNELEFTFA